MGIPDVSLGELAEGEAVAAGLVRPEDERPPSQTRPLKRQKPADVLSPDSVSAIPGPSSGTITIKEAVMALNTETANCRTAAAAASKKAVLPLQAARADLLARFDAEKQQYNAEVDAFIERVNRRRQRSLATAAARHGEALKVLDAQADEFEVSLNQIQAGVLLGESGVGFRHN